MIIVIMKIITIIYGLECQSHGLSQPRKMPVEGFKAPDRDAENLL